VTIHRKIGSLVHSEKLFYVANQAGMSEGAQNVLCADRVKSVRLTCIERS
jgi:hypothetical protein